MNCQLTFSTIIHYLTLYEVMPMRLVSKRWYWYITNDPLFWRHAYENFIFRLEPPRGKEITIDDFKRDYENIYDETWAKKLHKVILDILYERKITASFYMSVFDEMYEKIDNSEISVTKICDIAGDIKNDRVLKCLQTMFRKLLEN